MSTSFPACNRARIKYIVRDPARALCNTGPVQNFSEEEVVGVAADADAEELFPSRWACLVSTKQPKFGVTESYTRLPTFLPSSHFIATTSSMMTAS